MIWKCCKFSHEIFLKSHVMVDEYDTIYEDLLQNRNNFRTVINRLLMVKRRHEDARRTSLQIDDQLKQLKAQKKNEQQILCWVLDKMVWFYCFFLTGGLGFFSKFRVKGLLLKIISRWSCWFWSSKCYSLLFFLSKIQKFQNF